MLLVGGNRDSCICLRKTTHMFPQGEGQIRTRTLRTLHLASYQGCGGLLHSMSIMVNPEPCSVSEVGFSSILSLDALTEYDTKDLKPNGSLPLLMNTVCLFSSLCVTLWLCQWRGDLLFYMWDTSGFHPLSIAKTFQQDKPSESTKSESGFNGSIVCQRLQVILHACPF